MSQLDMVGGFTLTASVPVSADAPSIARRQVSETVGPELDAQRLDDARLLVSEIVTNAVRHAGLSATDEITVGIRRDDRDVVVEVSDPGRGFNPRPRPDTMRAGGWGLPLVQRLSDDWGVDPRPGGGSVVWFRIASRG